MPKYNAGEIDELKAKLALIYWRDNNENNISSVGLESNFLSHGLDIPNLKQLSNDAVIDLCQQCGATKSKSTFKADVVINDIPYSLKSHRKALPALLNHTHRDNIIKVCNRINLNISRLDTLVDEYWVLRKTGEYREDVKYINSVFSNDEDAMVTLLEYFLFRGTGMKDSEIPAKALYTLTDPFDFSNWTLHNSQNVARDILQGTTISMRSKGMPDSYSPTSVTNAHLNIRPWAEYQQGAYRGSIHIRG